MQNHLFEVTRGRALASNVLEPRLQRDYAFRSPVNTSIKSHVLSGVFL